MKSNEPQYNISSEFIYTKRDGKFIITSLSIDDQKIYCFEGPSAEILDLISQSSFAPNDYLKFSQKLGKTFSVNDWESFLNFCLEKKIFIKL